MTKNDVNKVSDAAGPHSRSSAPVSAKDGASSRGSGRARSGLSAGRPRGGNYAGREGAGSPSEDQRDKLLADIAAMLDVLTEDGLMHVLAVATMCRYELALVRKAEKPDSGDLPGTAPEGTAMRIERSVDGSTYHLILGKVWKILAAEEIASLLRITRHEEDEAAAAQRLFLWMKAERRDIAADLHIRSADSPALHEFLTLLSATFPIRSPRRLP